MMYFDMQEDFSNSSKQEDPSIKGYKVNQYQCRSHHYHQHELLYFEGEEATQLFEIIDGSVMLYKMLPDGRRQVVNILVAGDLFGFQIDNIYDCSAETLVPSTVNTIQSYEVKRCEELRNQVIQSAIKQVQFLREHAVLLGRKSAFERVASYIMGFIPERGIHKCSGPQSPEDDSAVISLAMTRQEIADFLGLTIETVSRILSAMQRRGLIRLEKQDRIYIANVCGLCRATGLC